MRNTKKQALMIVLGTAILSFAIHNIHQRVQITEGGVLGLILLAGHWFQIPSSAASFVLDACCYALALRFLGGRFLAASLGAAVSLAGFFRLWEFLPPLLPDLSQRPFFAALLGGGLVGLGVGLIVRQGASSGGDDALALTISHLTGWRLARAYLVTDLTVLLLSISYIPLRKIACSLVTVTVSSLLIDFLKELRLPFAQPQGSSPY